MTTDTDRPTFLLVHGAWHGSWCWDDLRTVLAADRWQTRAVDLPSSAPVAPGGEGAPPAGMRDDAEAIRAGLRSIDGPVVVVAHSYGGVPTTEAVADAPNVVRVVYLASFQLDVGESMYSFVGAPIPDDGTGRTPPPEEARWGFFGDVPDAVAERALARLAPQSVASLTGQVTTAGWRTVPSTYVICEQDRALEPSDQEKLAARARDVHRLPSSHSPFLSMPWDLADLLGRIALNPR